ncbi:hypothetical protein BG006_002728, partial [Podila minutissima]
MGLLKTFVLCALVAYVAGVAHARNCLDWDYIYAGDTCDKFAARHYTSSAQLFYCNPKVNNPRCDNLVV